MAPLAHVDHAPTRADRPHTTTSGPEREDRAVPCPGSYDDRFEELARLSYRLTFRIVGHREEARDLTQETMARAYAHWPRIEDKASGWVGRVATNLALDVVRRRRHHEPAATDLVSDVAPHAVQRTELVAALQSLPRRQREVVVLRYLADLPESEVARTLGCSVGAVKKHASRGLRSLRSRLALAIEPANALYDEHLEGPNR